MRAVTLDFEERRLVERDVAAPSIEAEDQVLFRVQEVGVCGTDRELAAFRLGYPPGGERSLVLGHEASGRVVETGRAVTRFRAGDCVVPMIRRPCFPPCSSCIRQRNDLCLTGRYTERGIFGRHGYFCELAVDAERDLFLVPDPIAEFAVLVEPLSVVEKAIGLAMQFHSTRNAEACIGGVFGAGPVGLLAAMTLKQRGLDVWLRSLEPPDHPRAQLARQAGIRYLASGDDPADIVIEATGSSEGAFMALRSLAPLGICAVLGASEGVGKVSFRDLVVGNQVVFGSVNSSPESFTRAIEDLGRFDRSTLWAMIERRPFSDWERSIAAPSAGPAKIAHVIH